MGGQCENKFVHIFVRTNIISSLVFFKQHAIEAQSYNMERATGFGFTLNADVALTVCTHDCVI